MRRRRALTDRLFLRGRVWWCWGYDLTGERWQESTRQTERRAALEAAREIERRRAVPRDRAADELTLEATLGLVIDADRRQGNADATIQFHRDHARHVLRLLGRQTRVATLQIADTNGYTDKRLEEGAHRHTIQKEIRVLIQGLYCAKELGLYAANPRDLKPKAFRKKRRYYKPRTRWLETAAQAQALIDHTSTGPQARIDRRGHVGAYILTGVRESELYAIEPAHVTLAKRTVWVDGTKTDGAPRIVYLNAAAAAIFEAKLAAHRPGQPLFEPWPSGLRDLKGAYRRARAAAARVAGCAPVELDGWPTTVSFNDLRRTFCSLMATAGVPLQHCASMLGHGSIDMALEVYARLAPPSLQAAADALPALVIGAVAVPVAATMSGTALDAQAARAPEATSA